MVDENRFIRVGGPTIDWREVAKECSERLGCEYQPGYVRSVYNSAMASRHIVHILRQILPEELWSEVMKVTPKPRRISRKSTPTSHKSTLPRRASSRTPSINE